MFQKVFCFALVGVAALMVLVPTAQAQYTPAREDTKKGTYEYVQRPPEIWINYETDEGGNLVIKFMAVPIYTACGKVTGMPVEIKYDSYDNIFTSADISVGDYSFIRPSGPKPYDCGPAYKVAQSEITLPADSIKSEEFKTIRFWYNRISDKTSANGQPIILGTVTDSYRLLRDDKGRFKLVPPIRPKFFKPDTRPIRARSIVEVSIPTPVVVEPASINMPEQIPSTSTKRAERRVMLSVINLPAEADVAPQVQALADDRHMTPTANRGIYIDEGGQFYFQLAFTETMPIGYVTGPDGQRYQVLASRAP